MPWDVVKRGDQWCVEKPDGSEPSMGSCHSTKEKAQAHVAALYANEPKMLRHLHLRGATLAARTEMLNGREHLVIPVVALMEGVIWPQNAKTPEFVPVVTLEEAALTWDKKPIVINHPTKNGKPCPADDVAVLAAQGIGIMLNPRVEGTKLLCDAWVDKGKAKKLDPELYARLLNNETEEVSVGAWVITDDSIGEWNGVAFGATWLKAIGDHLAFLPRQRGACSVEMGCGTHRAAMHFVAAKGIDMSNKTQVFLTLEGQSLEERLRAVDAAVNKKWNMYVWVQQVFDDRVIVQMNDEIFSVPYEMKDTDVEFGEPSKVKQTWVAAKEKAKAAVLPKVAAVKPQLKAADCGCKGATMTREELIATLVTDRFSGFKDGDEAILQAASDARLEEFRSASEAAKSAAGSFTRLEADNRNTVARLKVAEDRLRAADQPPTDEEWMAKAPAHVKTLIEKNKAEEDEVRAAYVSQLKDCGANSEAELKAMPIAQLATLAKYARVEVPDFSGRGFPQQRNAADDTANDDFTPPDPYAIGLKALQGSKAVN